MIPYGIYQGIKQQKVEKKEQMEKEEEQKKQDAAKRNFEEGKTLGNLLSTDFIDVARDLEVIAYNGSYASILDGLEKLSLPTSCKLVVQEAEQNGYGSHSSILVNVNGEEKGNIWEYISVENSPMGVWQAFLLKELWHKLPLFWHANYCSRHYIYTEEDIDTLPKIINFKRTLHQFDITPYVVKSNNKWYVSVCYWNNWSGLVREHIEVTLENGKVTNFFDLDDDKLYEYKCGIRF